MTEADERLAAAADRHLSNNPEGQVVLLLLEWIAAEQPDWLTPTTQRDLWPTEVRFEWLLARPGVRARVVSELTGISDGAARRLDPDVQIALVDAVLDNGDTPIALWADAFQPKELAAHAPPGAMHSRIRECFPWMAPASDERQAFLGMWLEELLSRGDGNGRSRDPILEALPFRAAIDPEVWQANVPLAMRAAVDEARIQAESEQRPYTAAEELAVVSVETLVTHIPYASLQPILEAAEKALGNELEIEIVPVREDTTPDPTEVHIPEIDEHGFDDNEPTMVGAAPFSDDDLRAVIAQADDGDEEDGDLPALDITRTENMTDEVPRM